MMDTKTIYNCLDQLEKALYEFAAKVNTDYRDRGLDEFVIEAKPQRLSEEQMTEYMQHPEDALTYGVVEMTNHLLWMVQTVRTEFMDIIATTVDMEKRASTREKVMRWIGFMQGALWASGEMSIEQLKRMNTTPAETFDIGKV